MSDKSISQCTLEVKSIKPTPLDAVLPSIVSIKYYRAVSFDVEKRGSYEATGFVVDQNRGYILTNRHVAGTGPWHGRAIFNNHEECELRRVYADPIHDFAYVQFDPASLERIELTEIPLRPDLARVGEKIQVIGNDAGEKLSILPGVLSRVDRNAPEYAKEGYQDFDTSYLQASVNGTGGSSGSPVLNSDNFAVGLQSGEGFDQETNYFLPLDRALRTLQCLQARHPISRGTMQCSWLWKSFKDCLDLGLSDDLKKEVTDRFPDEMGMLVARTVLPEGPSDGKIAEGDVLIRINGQFLTKFPLLDEILDSNVGESVELVLQRGPKTVTVAVDVEDLHKITPDRYISAAGGTFHRLSFQKAHAYNRSCRGVFVSGAVGSFKAMSGHIVLKVDDKDTPDLDSFQSVMKSIPDRARVAVSYRSLEDQNITGAIVQIDHYWVGSMKLVTRQGFSEIWDSTTFAQPLSPVLPTPLSASFPISEAQRCPGEEEILPCLLMVDFTTPISLDGSLFNESSGSGVILDAEAGYAIVSGSVVFQDLGNVSITIASSIVIDGEVVLLHPQQNYAIIKFDPSLIQAPIRSAKLSKDPIKIGDRVFFIGNKQKNFLVDEATIAAVTPKNTELSPQRLRYRAVNLDAISILSHLRTQCRSGVLVADKAVVAFWLQYIGADDDEEHLGYRHSYWGLKSAMVAPVIEDVRRGVTPELRLLDTEFSVLEMSDARTYRVPESWIKKVESQPSGSRKLFRVKKVAARSTGGQDTLLEGDVLLTLNDELITWYSELDRMQCQEVLTAHIIRSGVEMDVQVRTIAAKELQTDIFVRFCGAVVQKPHYAIKQHMQDLPNEVFVSSVIPGSPADHYGLKRSCFITAVGYKSTPDIKTFYREAARIPHNTYVTLRVVETENVTSMVSLQKNEQDFPTEVWVKDEQHARGWVQRQ